MGSADETVIPTYARTIVPVDSITIEGVDAAYSAYEGVVPAIAGADKRIGIADEDVGRGRQLRQRVQIAVIW
jgi:hypothetical protein